MFLGYSEGKKKLLLKTFSTFPTLLSMIYTYLSKKKKSVICKPFDFGPEVKIIDLKTYALCSPLMFYSTGQQAIVMALCPLCVRACECVSINSSFKKLLLRNYWLDFYKISQECSLGGPLSNSFK